MEITLVYQNDYCIIKIADNGRGMDEETLQHACEALFTKKERAAGLGLTLVQNIILNHGGV
ncbi:MAG: hypothetical protein C4308_06560 [Chitinophagaceae bacterium]